MEINSTVIEDAFAEAFSMKFTRLVITAIDQEWLDIATREFCGYGTSIIGCDAEVGVESSVPASQTPDGRAGVSVLAFAFSMEALELAVTNRVGQCLLPCPTTAVFNGLPATEKTISLGRHLRFFGDGFQKSKLLGDRRYWRIPVMDGEFLVEEIAGADTGVAGGNFLLQAVDQRAGLAAAKRAIDAIDAINGVITPFPGGVVRSGSKVGSRYKALRASTSEAFCPTLRGQVDTRIHETANCVYEIVIDGADFAGVARAIAAGIRAAVGNGKSQGVIAISAGNYGGKLGQHHFHLHELLTH